LWYIGDYSIRNITKFSWRFSVKIWQIIENMVLSQNDRTHLFKFILIYDDVMSIEIFYSSIISIENIRVEVVVEVVVVGEVVV
jgi:hypothetical protein